MRSDARDSLQNLIAGLEDGGVFDEPIHALFQVVNLFFEVFDVLVDAVQNIRRSAGHASGVPLVFFHSPHVHELSPAVVQLAQGADFLGFQGSDLGGRNLAEVGDDGGINGVGLG